MQKLPFLFTAVIITIGLILVIFRMVKQENNQISPRQPDLIPTSSPSTPNISTIPDTQLSPSVKQVVSDDCLIGGCSGQLCVDASMGDVASTCEWRDEYACYSSASCERQANGKCGWTTTSELQQCITEARSKSGMNVAF